MLLRRWNRLWTTTCISDKTTEHLYTDRLTGGSEFVFLRETLKYWRNLVERLPCFVWGGQTGHFRNQKTGWLWSARVRPSSSGHIRSGRSFRFSSCGNRPPVPQANLAMCHPARKRECACSLFRRGKSFESIVSASIEDNLPTASLTVLGFLLNSFGLSNLIEPNCEASNTKRFRC